MPYEIVGDTIEKGLQDKLRMIKQLLKQSKKADTEDSKGSKTTILFTMYRRWFLSEMAVTRPKFCLGQWFFLFQNYDLIKSFFCADASCSKGSSPRRKLSPDPETCKELERLTRQVERYREIVDQQEKLILVSLFFGWLLNELFLSFTSHSWFSPDWQLRQNASQSAIFLLQFGSETRRIHICSCLHEFVYFQESLTNQNENAGAAILDENDLWEEKERLSQERSRLLEQRQNFEQERKNFTEAAIRLSKEVRTIRSAQCYQVCKKPSEFFWHVGFFSAEATTWRRKDQISSTTVFAIDAVSNQRAKFRLGFLWSQT